MCGSAPNVDVAFESVRRDVGVTSVALVDAQGADDDLVGGDQGWNALGRQVRAKERLALLAAATTTLLLVAVVAVEALAVGHAKGRHLGVACRGTERRQLLQLRQSLGEIGSGGRRDGILDILAAVWKGRKS